MQPAPSDSIAYAEVFDEGAGFEDVADSFVAEAAFFGFGVDVGETNSGVCGFDEDVGGT